MKIKQVPFKDKARPHRYLLMLIDIVPSAHDA